MSDKTGRALRMPLAVMALAPAPGPRPHGVHWHEAQATVSVRGELDRDAVWAIDYTLSRAAIDAGRIVLDLREVTHLDSAGVPALVERRNELRARGGDLRIAVRSPYVAKILAAASGSTLQTCRDPEQAFDEARVCVTRARRRQ
ncbi:MAG: STAS domain-containing protein [Deltaproteobacteria bacterium]|nr:MAG: STAS domain-containing protein [Deltaproteobacteria bacterium]TMB28707.1 MAG: STAS domain-containing protein [Deltaproteobacteria bacterium]